MSDQRARTAGPRRVGRNERGGSSTSPPRRVVGPYPEDSEVPRFVVHLSVVTADLPAALNLACALAGSLSFMKEIDAGETTVSDEGDPRVHHRVFCDRLLPDRARCAARAGHPGRCAPYQPT